MIFIIGRINLISFNNYIYVTAKNKIKTKIGVMTLKMMINK